MSYLKMKLRRQIERWRGADPATIAAGSETQCFYCIDDARADILALATVVEQAEDGAEIIGNLIASIESHGMYSKESTLGFLTQAFYCLRQENPHPEAPKEGQ